MVIIINNVVQSKPFLLLLFYIIIAVFIVPFVGMSLPFSVYYHSEFKLDQQRVGEENSRQANEAERTLKTHHRLEQINQTVQTDPEFCVVIPSVSRPAKVRYLTQVVAALLPQITHHNFVYTVLNVEGANHTEAINLSSLVHVETRTGRHSKDVYMNEKEDYVRSLKWCLEKGATFSVILEDDVLPTGDFFHRLKFVLQYRMPTDSSKWAFLKLYYPEKWEGWGNEWRLVLELVVTSLCGGILLSLLIYVFQLLLVQTLPSKLEFLVVESLSSILILYVLLSVGRPHWLSLRSWSHHLSSVVSSPGCCTPAVVYPQVHLADLIKYLENTKCSEHFPVDLALDKFASEKGLEHLLVVPNMVKHIGFVSSLGKGGKRPQDFRLS